MGAHGSGGTARRARRHGPFDPGVDVPAPGLAVRGGGRGVLRGLQQRHPVADLPRRHRAAVVPPRLVAAYAASTSGSPTPSPRWPPRARRSGCRTTSCSSSRGWSANSGPTCGSGGSTTSPSRRSSCSPSCRGARGSSRACSAPTSSASSARPTPRTSSAPAGGCSVTTKGDTVTVSAATARRQVRASADPDLHRLPRPRGRWQAPRRSWPRAARDPPAASATPHPHARRRPARLHQGHPAPAQGLRRAVRRGRSSRRTSPSSRSPRPAASGSTPTASCASEIERPSAGSTASIGRSARRPVHYLHHSYPREEMAALYLAADVMLVTPLRTA